MRINQINTLQKIMAGFSCDYRAAEQLDARHTELNDAVLSRYITAAIRPHLESCGVRRQVLETVFEDYEFEECMDAFIQQLTGIVARWDMADQIDSARDAA